MRAASPSLIGSGLDLAEFLKTGDKASDIEGGAIIGDIVYWISSHSLPKSGKPRDWRKQFFATRVAKVDGTPSLVAHLHPYTGLLDAMIRSPELSELQLAAAAKELPEQPGGLNIEGLATWKGDGLPDRVPEPAGQRKGAPRAAEEPR